jgi:hypothetical protein
MITQRFDLIADSSARVSEGDGSAGPSRRHAARGAFHMTPYANRTRPPPRGFAPRRKRTRRVRSPYQRGICDKRVQEGAEGLAAAAAASKIQQDRMSEILTNVKRTVDEISKTTQIIDNPSIQANFSVSCLDEKFKLICDKIIASEGEKRLPVGTYELDNSAWKDETKKFRLVQLQLIFYQDGDALARFKKECLTCFPRGDIDMSLDVLDNEKTPATFMYDSSKKDIFVEFRGKVNVDVSKKHLMTVPDLLGSSLVMYAFNSDELQGLVPKFVILRTDRGQTVAIGDFSKEIVDNRDIYISKKIISP